MLLVTYTHLPLEKCQMCGILECHALTDDVWNIYAPHGNLEALQEGMTLTPASQEIYTPDVDYESYELCEATPTENDLASPKLRELVHDRIVS